MESKLSLLDVGCGPNILPKDVLHYDVLVRVDANPDNNPDYVHDIRNPLPEELHGKFDLVYLSHVLEHIDRVNVHNVVKNVSKAVKNGGELWIVVPSLEWTIERFDSFRPTDIVFHAMMFGGQRNEWDYHRSAFTLFDLRRIMEMAGLIVRRAYQTDFYITFGERKELARQNVIIGMRYDED